MHSVHIIGSSGLGGAESFYARLIHGLHRQGDRVTAINRPDSPVSRVLDQSITQMHPRMVNHFDFISRMQIRRFARLEQPEIIQTYMTRATTLTHIPEGRGTVHVARLGGYYRLKRFSHAHAWVGNTRGICDYMLENGFPADRVFYIGNFVGDIQSGSEAEKAATRSESGIPDDALVVSAAGRFIEKKGFDVLLEAFARLPAEIDDRPVHLILIGDGRMREKLERQASAIEGKERIHWTGWQTNPGPWYQLADVCVCPSHDEPLGNVILEAWRHGKPIVSTRTMGGEELISDSGDGLLVPVGDAQGMSAAIGRYLTDPDLRAANAAAGLQRVTDEFSEAAIVSQYRELYQQLSS